MAFRVIRIAVLLSSLPIAGCGTIANLARPGPAGGKIPFGGVRQDMECIKTAADGASGISIPPNPEPDQHLPVARMLLYAADLPFTLAGDVLTWPYSATYTYINQPVPVPPILQAPPSPVIQGVTQGVTQGQPQTSPSLLLQEPRKQP